MVITSAGLVDGNADCSCLLLRCVHTSTCQPGPRKSAIRARPQVFESPSAYTRSATQAALAVPNPNPAPEGVAASMLVPARHSNSNSNPNPNPDPNKVQETEAEMRPPSPEEVVTASVSQTQNNSTRASAGSEMMVDVTKTIEIPAEDGGASRKKRRVTFSRRQEKT